MSRIIEIFVYVRESIIITLGDASVIAYIESIIERVLTETQANRPFAGFGSTLSFSCVATSLARLYLPDREKKEVKKMDILTVLADTLLEIGIEN